MNYKYKESSLKVSLYSKDRKLTVKESIRLPITQWTLLKLQTFSIESSHRIDFKSFFSSLLQLSVHHRTLSAWISRDFFSGDRELGFPRGRAVKHASDARTQWSPHSEVNWRLEVVSPVACTKSDSSGTRHKVPVVPVYDRADFWEHRCTIDDPGQSRYCFRRVKNTPLRHAIIFVADACASLLRQRNVSSHFVFVTEHKCSGYLKEIETRLGINEECGLEERGRERKRERELHLIMTWFLRGNIFFEIYSDIFNNNWLLKYRKIYFAWIFIFFRLILNNNKKNQTWIYSLIYLTL